MGKAAMIDARMIDARLRCEVLAAGGPEHFTFACGTGVSPVEPRRPGFIASQAGRLYHTHSSTALVRRAVRCAVLMGVLTACVGCDLFPAFVLPPSQELSPVVGGLADTRPFYGKVMDPTSPDEKMGDFLLASCGCGDWRGLIKLIDGGEQTQFVMRFYTAGEYVPTGVVSVYGSDEFGGISGLVNQDSGTSDGRVEIGDRRMYYTAARGESHTDKAVSCVMCHIGDDPIWPLPDTHTASYVVDPPNCLSCHDAG